MRLLLCLCAVLLFWGCKKDGGSPSQPFDFSFTGLPDTVWMEQVDTVEIPISLNLLSRTGELVTLQISGLPASIGASFTPDLDTPSFNSILRLVGMGASLDTYSIVVTVNGSRLERKDSFKLVVGPNPVNPATFLKGNYAATGLCSYSGSKTDTITISEELPMFNKLRMRGLWHRDAVLMADYDPGTNALTIPAQQTLSAGFSGTGVVNGNQIIINYIVDFGVAKDTCSAVLMRY